MYIIIKITLCTYPHNFTINDVETSFEDESDQHASSNIDILYQLRI